MDIKIIKSKYCGFCSGVTRAIQLAEKAASGGKRVYTLGPIIHNPQVVENLKKKDIINKNIGSIENSSTVLIRSHGVTLEDEEKLKALNAEVIDATCSIVKHVHKICGELAEEFGRVFVIGIKSHPEVKGILSRAAGKAVVLSSVNEARKISSFSGAGVIAQTTFRQKDFFNIVSELVKKARILKIYNTICSETINRQKELKEIAEKVDVLFVIGGKNSSNTKRLFEMGSSIVQTYHLETPDELECDMIRGKKTVGIVTGASTPIEMVNKIENKLFLIKKNCKEGV